MTLFMFLIVFVVFFYNFMAVGRGWVEAKMPIFHLTSCKSQVPDVKFPIIPLDVMQKRLPRGVRGKTKILRFHYENCLKQTCARNTIPKK